METRELGISGSERIFAGSLLRVGMLAALLSAGADAIVFTISTSLAKFLLGVVFDLPDEAVTQGRGVGASVAGSTLVSMHAVAAGTDAGLLTRLVRGRSCRGQRSGEGVGNRSALLRGPRSCTGN